MKINDLHNPKLAHEFIKTIFDPKDNIVYSLEHPSIKIKDYQPLIDLVKQEAGDIKFGKYYLFNFIHNNPLIPLVFVLAKKSMGVNFVISVNLGTGNYEI